MEFSQIRRAIEARPGSIGKRMIFHGGAPKTGTTSLQFYLHENRDALDLAHITYPKAGTENLFVPKHQWIHHYICNGVDESRFSEILGASLDETNDKTRIILFSAEALFNNWGTYNDDARQIFSVLAEYFKVECVIWLRDPPDYFRSLYLQALTNPANAEDNGGDLSPSDWLQLQMEKGRVQYKNTLESMNIEFGHENFYVFHYSGDAIKNFTDLFDIKYHGAALHRNASIESEAAVSILRTINQLEIPAREKRDISGAITSLDQTLKRYGPRFELDDEAVRSIRETCGLSEEDLVALDRSSAARWFSRWPRG